MCVTYTIRYTCGCDEAIRQESNGCGGHCTGDAITYDESLDEDKNKPCLVYQYATPPTSSDDSALSRPKAASSRVRIGGFSRTPSSSSDATVERAAYSGSRAIPARAKPCCSVAL